MSRTALVLNPTGGWMWSRLDTPRTADDLVQDLRGRYPSVSAAQARLDVDAFLDELARHSMITAVP